MGVGVRKKEQKREEEEEEEEEEKVSISSVGGFLHDSRWGTMMEHGDRVEGEGGTEFKRK